MEANTKFSVYMKDKEFGTQGFDFKKHKILFKDIKSIDEEQQIKFSGIPYIVVGVKRMDCTHSVDHAISGKKKQVEERLNTKVQFNCHFLFEYDWRIRVKVNPNPNQHWCFLALNIIARFRIEQAIFIFFILFIRSP